MTVQANSVESPEDPIDEKEALLQSSIAKKKTIPGLPEALVSVRTSARGL